MEDSVFDHDFAGHVMPDDVMARLLTLNNVLMTSHRGFPSREALKDIAETTLSGLTAFEEHKALVNQVKAQR